MDATQTQPKTRTHREIATGISGSGDTIWLVNTICDRTGTWLHSERFGTLAAAENWLAFA